MTPKLSDTDSIRFTCGSMKIECLAGERIAVGPQIQYEDWRTQVLGLATVEF